MKHNLFVYGTLSFPEVLSAALKRKVTKDDFFPANLHGFRRYAVSGMLFPVIRKNTSTWVDGFIVKNITDEDLKNADQWEKDIYERIAVRVMTEAGTPYEAWTYADSKEKAPILDHDWDAEAFRKAGKMKA